MNRMMHIIAAALCAVAATAMAIDNPVTADYTLTANETVDGILTVNTGVTVELNGHNLTVNGLAGDGTITAAISDLTSPDPDGERVSSPTTFSGSNPTTSPVNLFNDNYTRGDNSNRVIVAAANLPMEVTYDFGEGNPQAVDMYKIYIGPLGSYHDRGPRTWTFEGSNNTNESWTTLHSVDSEMWTTTQETRVYSFDNDTAYRWYRISITAATATDWLELVQLEYFDLPDSAPELRINVPTGVAVTNSTVTIGGNVRLVKQGEGEFVAAMASQTYSGGNHIEAGTLKPLAASNTPLGLNGSDITVDADATFDINGSPKCSLYRYILNGGTVQNTGPGLGESTAQVGDMTLTKDSSFNAVNSLGFVKQLYAPLTIDLGGNELLVSAGGYAAMFTTADIKNGTLRLVRGGGGAVYFKNGSSSAMTATLDMETHTGAYNDMSVSNMFLRSAFTAHTSESANGVYYVHGTFMTETQTFPSVTMMDGSTLDLKSQDDAFSLVSSSANPNGFKITLADGATVTIDVSGRSLALGDCLISWDEIPEGATFQFDETTAAGGVQPIATERGLFYGYIDDVAEWAWWTGAANDGSLTNPENWTCKNADGGVIDNGLPSSVTRVYLGGSLNVSIPASSSDFPCGVCILSNATLAADCDLRGLGTRLQVVSDSTIDLNGHKLYAHAAAFTNDCTVSDADIDHDDDLTTTDTSCVSSSSFNSGTTPASNLFNNYYTGGNNSKRVLVPVADWPLVVTYNFGEGKVVDAYRLWVKNSSVRCPGSWKFEGANSADGDWTLLDTRKGETAWPNSSSSSRIYTFSNTTAYQYYRITVEGNSGGADGYGTFIEFVQLEYFNIKPTQGELHVETTSGETVELSSMSLAGNMRLFIEGEGLLRLGKAGQTYVGGTEICGGTVAGGYGLGSLLNKDVFGGKGSEIVVRGNNTTTASATCGVLGFLDTEGYTGYKYVLDGGSIMDAGDGTVTELRLTTNSWMGTSSDLPKFSYAWFGWSGDKHVAYADLGGYELSVDIGGAKNFVFANATIENGSVYTGTQNGTFVVTNSVVATNNVSFRLNSNANCIGETFTVMDCAQIRSFPNYNFGEYDIDVFGVFAPSAQGYFHGTTLHDGSTIDLSGLGIDTLSVIAPYNSESSSAQGAKTLHFESGATIGVKLGARKVSKNTPLISWDEDTQPDATVTFVSTDRADSIEFEVREDGLYAVSKNRMIIIVR